jgi:hypothetical protein
VARVEDLVTLGLREDLAKHLGFTVATGLVATGNASQANALQLTSDINYVGTVTATENSVKCPLAVNHAHCFMAVRNGDAADTLNIYPGSGDSFNFGVADAGTTIAAGRMRILFRASSTSWIISGDI